MNIQVTLNTAGKPPVTVSPTSASVERGTSTITWTQAPGQTFSFTSLAFTGNPSCCSKATVTATQMTVQDANINPGAAVDYPYTIVVTSNNTPYSSAPAGIGGNPGDPMIKNK